MILNLHMPINKGMRMIIQTHACVHTNHTHKGNTIRPNTTYDS